MRAGERLEAVLGELIAHELVVRGDGGRARLLVEQGHLAEDGAGREGGQALRAVPRQVDLHAGRALGDQEQRAVLIALLDDRLAGAITAADEKALRDGALRGAEAFESREPPEGAVARLR